VTFITHNIIAPLAPFYEYKSYLKNISITRYWLVGLLTQSTLAGVGLICHQTQLLNVGCHAASPLNLYNT